MIPPRASDNAPRLLLSRALRPPPAPRNQGGTSLARHADPLAGKQERQRRCDVRRRERPSHGMQQLAVAATTTPPLRRNGAAAASEFLWTNADDRLPGASLGRVEGGDGIVEGRDVADVRPQASVPHPLDDLTQLGTIGLDDEVDRQAVGGPRLGLPYDGHQGSSGPDQAC